MSSKVDFFIVGAPKCGTTALSAYLNRLDSVYIPEIKEPHYFCTDWPEFRRVNNSKDYQKLYKNASEKLKGDASVWYLYSENAAAEIKAYNKNAKIIIMVRKQCDVVASLHSQLIFSGRENVKSLGSAWRAQEERREGKRVPKNAIVKEHLIYKDVFDYPKQIDRYIENFGKKNCLIIVYDDFFWNIKEKFKEVVEFLGLDTNYDVDFEKLNSNRVHKYPALSHFLMRPPGVLGKIKNAIKFLPFLRNKPILRSFYRKLSTTTKRERMSEELSKEIMAEYFESNVRLSKILGYKDNIWP